MTKMKYILEISNMQGDPIADEDDDYEGPIESDTPIPIPSEGEIIQFSNQHSVKVVKRIFAYLSAKRPEDDATAYVWVLCEDVKASGKKADIDAESV
jgi:hypothetical protein